MKFTVIAIALVGLASPATAFTSFADSRSGSAPIKPASYGPSSGIKRSAPGPGTLGAPSNYLAGMNGSASPAHPAAPAAPPAYVDNGTTAPVNGASAPAAATSSGYLSQMGGGSSNGGSSGPKTNYSPFKGSFKSGSSGMNSYLDRVAPSPQSTSAPGAAAPVASSSPAASGPRTNYSPFNKGGFKTGTSGIKTYLDNVAPSAQSTSAPAASATGSGPSANTSGGYLSGVGGGSNMAGSSGPKASYSPYKSAAGKSGSSGFGSYLDGVSGNAAPSGGFAPAAPASSIAAAAMPVDGSAPPNNGSYLSQMGQAKTGGMQTSAPKTSYAPTKWSPRK